MTTTSRLPFIPSRETAEKLRGMLDYIAERGRAMRFDMDNFAIPERCGTVCCLAGFVAEKEGVLPDPDPNDRNSDLMYTNLIGRGGMHISIAEFAQNYLGGEGVAKLFYTSDWPGQYHRAYQRAKSGPEKLDVLEQRIEHYISTGY